MKTCVNVPEEKRGPMSDMESKAMATFLIASQKTGDTPVPAKQLEEEMIKFFNEPFVKSFSIQVIIKRLEQTPPEVLYSPYAVAMCGILSRTPGVAVLWAYTLYDEASRFVPVTLNRLTELFPWGFPKDEGYHEIWDAQKGYTQDPPLKIDNLLDSSSVWKPA